MIFIFLIRLKQTELMLIWQESVVDFQEIEEALMIVKQRKEKANQELEFLEKVDNMKTEGALQSYDFVYYESPLQ